MNPVTCTSGCPVSIPLKRAVDSAPRLAALSTIGNAAKCALGAAVMLLGRMPLAQAAPLGLSVIAQADTQLAPSGYHGGGLRSLENIMVDAKAHRLRDCVAGYHGSSLQGLYAPENIIAACEGRDHRWIDSNPEWSLSYARARQTEQAGCPTATVAAGGAPSQDPALPTFLQELALRIADSEAFDELTVPAVDLIQRHTGMDLLTAGGCDTHALKARLKAMGESQRKEVSRALRGMSDALNGQLKQELCNAHTLAPDIMTDAAYVQALGQVDSLYPLLGQPINHAQVTALLEVVLGCAGQPRFTAA